MALGRPPSSLCGPGSASILVLAPRQRFVGPPRAGWRGARASRGRGQGLTPSAARAEVARSGRAGAGAVAGGRVGWTAGRCGAQRGSSPVEMATRETRAKRKRHARLASSSSRLLAPPAASSSLLLAWSQAALLSTPSSPAQASHPPAPLPLLQHSTLSPSPPPLASRTPRSPRCSAATACGSLPSTRRAGMSGPRTSRRCIALVLSAQIRSWLFLAPATSLSP